MVVMRDEALVLWGDGILVSCWVEFGGIQRSDALGILEGGVLGSVSGFRVVRGDFGVDLVVEREAVMVEVWPRLGGELGEV